MKKAMHILRAAQMMDSWESYIISSHQKYVSSLTFTYQYLQGLILERKFAQVIVFQYSLTLMVLSIVAAKQISAA